MKARLVQTNCGLPSNNVAIGQFTVKMSIVHVIQQFNLHLIGFGKGSRESN